MPSLVNTYLYQEHEVILRFISTLKKEIYQLREGKYSPLEDYEKMLFFAREYADRIHHFKEETLLFTELNLASSTEGGPRCIYYKELQLQRTPVFNQVNENLILMQKKPRLLFEQWRKMMGDGNIANPLLEEHALGRSLLELFKYELHQFLEGISKNSLNLAFVIYRYVALMEEHIEKENTCLAYIVDQCLDHQTQIELTGFFKEVDNKNILLIEKSITLLKELE